MRYQKLTVFILFISGFYNLHAVNRPTAKNFINHADWSFVENKGQITDKGIAYYGHQGGVYLYCRPGMISFVFTKEENTQAQISEATGQPSGFPLSGKGAGGFDLMRNKSSQPSKITTSRTDLTLIASNPSAQIFASDQQEYYENFYTTGNADSGITNVHTYKTITYKDIYPDIDMVLMAKPSGVEYSFVIYPGGKVSDIQMQWVGIENIIRRDAYGKKLKDLKIEYSCALGKIEESTPYSYVGADPCVRPLAEDRADTRVRPYNASQKIESQFVLKNNQGGFKVADYDRTKTLVIDPTIIWGADFGGSANDNGLGVATDDSGHVYITGATASVNGIATNGAYQTSFSGGVRDAFLAKFKDDGTRLWSTYYGSGADDGNCVVTDALDNAYITGNTQSAKGIATSGAYQVSYGGGGDGFISKFNGKGILQWATYFGGKGSDYSNGIASDRAGNLTITGFTTSSSGIATNGSYQTFLSGVSDAFLACFNKDGQIKWANYYGGPGQDYGEALAYDISDNLYVTGYTLSSSGIATNGAYQTLYGGGNFGDAFLSKFNSAGNLVWATYFGGSQTDEAYGINVDSVENIYITGTTESSSGIATQGAYETYFGGGYEIVFLAKFNWMGSCLWATYYGGDEGHGVVSDKLGNIYIAGSTTNSGLATHGAYQTSFIGNNYEAFIAEFDHKGSRKWATYYGGYPGSYAQAIDIDSSGNIYTVGNTAGDAYLVKFGLVDAGISMILNPKDSLCPARQNIKALLHNYGKNPLTSLIISWSINGILQSDYHWQGTLAADSSLIVTLGNFLFFLGKDTIKSWASMPNGYPDPNPENDSTIFIANVIPPPIVNTGPNKTICENSSVTLGGTGVNGDTYSWTSNPPGFTSTLSNPTVTPLQTTTYYFTVTVTATGCSNTDSVVITVIPAPFAFAGLHQFVCKGDSASIGGPDINGYLYDWTSLPTGFSSSVSNPVVSPGTSTSYILLVTDTATGCTNSASVLVTVIPLLVANVGQSVFQICSGARVKLGGNATSDLVYSWNSSPTGFSSSMSDPVVMPLTNTEYYLSVRDTATNCSNRDSTSVILSASQAPVADAGVNQTICAGDSIPIGSHGSSGNTYSWVSRPAGFKSAFPVPVVKPDTTTTYFLTVTNTAGCVNFDSTIITVNPKPKLKPGMSQITCGDVAIQLGAPSDSGISYLWRSNPTGFGSTLSNPIDSPKVNTVYHLKEAISATGCTDSDSVTVTIVPRPSLGFNITHVNGFEYLFTLKTQGYPAYLYHWDFGDTSPTSSDTVHGYSVNHTYSKNGKYIVTLTFQLPGFCMETDTESVIVNEQFSLNIFPNPFPTQTDINYTLASPAHVKISLTDELGQQLGTLLDKQLTQGVYNTYFDARLWGLRPAMYFILFQLDDKLYVRKIIQLEDR